MRLTEAQKSIIKSLVREQFGADASVRLFGSRIDDSKKGGDYDFFVETSLDQADEIIQRKIALIVALQSSPSFEDEKIDLIVKRRHSSFDMPIYAVATEAGVLL